MVNKCFCAKQDICFRLQHLLDTNEGELCRIRSEFFFSVEKKFGHKYEQEAYAGCCEYFTNKVKECSEVQPFQEYQVAIVNNSKNDDIRSIRSEAHAGHGGRPVI